MITNILKSLLSIVLHVAFADNKIDIEKVILRMQIENCQENC